MRASVCYVFFNGMHLSFDGFTLACTVLPEKTRHIARLSIQRSDTCVEITLKIKNCVVREVFGGGGKPFTIYLFFIFSNGLHTLWSAALLTNTSAVPSCRLETAVASMPKRELRCASSFLPLLKSNLFTAFETSEQASPNWRLRDIIRQVKWMKKIFVQKRQRWLSEVDYGFLV